MDGQEQGRRPPILVTGLSGNLGRHLAPRPASHPLVVAQHTREEAMRAIGES